MKCHGVHSISKLWNLASFFIGRNFYLYRPYSTHVGMKANMQKIFVDQNLQRCSIVISGISGRFPQSKSIDEFKTKLMDGQDLLQPHTRFTVGKRLPPRIGSIDNLDKFDSEFFNVPDKMAHAMDPAVRTLLEVTFEAIIDAGINPASLADSTTGVFVGSDTTETLNFWKIKHGKSKCDEYTALGTPFFMIANQVSHLLHLKGTSFTTTTACSSSLHAVESAVGAIISGKCERAIVAGTTLHLSSHQSNDLNVLGALSPTGESKPFNKSANGFVRSEAIVSILIEKEDIAKRCYAKIRGIGSSTDGFKKKGIFNPSGISHQELYRQVYTEAGIDPGSVFYIETHGTGTQTGDPQELLGISQVFCTSASRTQPLLIGSVKSNMGHGEAAAGLCSVAKILIAAQEGIIPRTINFTEPNPALSQFFDGSLKLVTENTPISDAIVGISSFGIGGTNAHLILEISGTHKPNSSSPILPPSVSALECDPSKSQCLPMLIPMSGREEHTLHKKLGDACTHAHNFNFAYLIHEVFKQRVNGHSFCGYGIASIKNDFSSNPHVSICKMDSGEVRPIWLTFSGIGSQWQGMGKELMRIDVFQESYQKSRATLKNNGVDLDALLLPNNTSIFTNICNAANTIAVMQIALYDTLKSIGVRPHGYFGHSFGEILCAYADGSLTAEETLQIVDARGRAMLEGAKEDFSGAMAVVGLSWSEIQIRCQSGSNSEVFPACHNGPQNVTVSGKESAINDFVKKLQNEGIFAKKINSCGVAEHSPLILPAYTLYSSYLQEIFKGQTEKERTNRWISTSIPESQWDSNLAKNVSPEYFLNNFVSPVFFQEALTHIPKNAILIEIAPQGLLEKNFKTSLPHTCTLIAPMQKKNESNAEILYFFTSIGQIWNAGADLNISKLYPPVQVPVSSQTPSVGSLIEWKHDRSWIVPLIENTEKYTQGMLNIDLEDSAFSYLEGHKLEDRIVFPATGYLVFAWHCFASSQGSKLEEFPVKFTDVNFERAVFLNRDRQTQLRCSFHRGENTFEIHENGSTVAFGNISESKLSFDNSWEHNYEESFLNSLECKDIYKELRLRGYNFSGDFVSIKRMDCEGKWTEVFWNGNWTTFLDSILQSSLVGNIQFKSTFVPVKISSLIVDPIKVQEYIKKNNREIDSIPVQNNVNSRQTRAPGIEANSIVCQTIPKRNQQGNLAISEYLFKPYFEKIGMDSSIDSIENSQNYIYSTLAKMVDIYLENCQKKHITIYDTFTKSENSVRNHISQIFARQPIFDHSITSLSTEAEISKIGIKSEGTYVSKPSLKDCIPEHSNADLIFLDDPMHLEPISKIAKNDTWIILRQNGFNLMEDCYKKNQDDELQIISGTNLNGENVVLFRKTQRLDSKRIQFLSIDEEEFNWLPKLKNLLSADFPNDSSRIYIYSQKNATSGIIGLVKCLMREPGGEKLRCIFDPELELKNDINNPNDKRLSKLINRDLILNVFQNGIYGSYRHIPLNTDILDKETKYVDHARVIATKAGDLSTFRWMEAPFKYWEKTKGSPIGTIINTKYVSLNFRDIMIASARLQTLSNEELNLSATDLGFEFSGTDKEGNRIMGVGPVEAIATSILLKKNKLIWKVPGDWSLEEAATVPVVYSTAYYSLIVRGNIKQGNSILIHSGTGGVGQAAINLALSMNCEVFTTVGTKKKRKHILQLFPTLPEENISSSRNCEFEQNILEKTNGRGVDFVLNSLADDKLHSSLRCLASKGTFLEIGKFDLYKDTSIGMLCFTKNVNFQVIDLTGLIVNIVPHRERLQKLVEDGIISGVVKPLERTVFNKDQVEDAFRFMAAGNHMGKVVIEIDKEKTICERVKKVKAIPKSFFDPEKTFIIVGGLGGLGLELVNWMIQRGAKHLILTTRSGVTNGYQQLCLNRWRNLGVRVETPKIDLSVYDTAKTFLKDFIKERNVLGGFFNSGLVIKDSLLQNQTEEMFKEVAKPKIKVTENMDKLTREFCKDHLDYFVTFSSLSAGLGNAGQSNYGFANSAMEQICLQRRKDGFHSASIQWGVIGDVGYVAENMKEDQVFDGMLPQKVSSCLEVLDAFLERSKATECTVFSSMVVNDKTCNGNLTQKATLLDIVARLCNIKVPLETIIPSAKLTDLGLDSLSATELQQLLYREHDMQLSSMQVQALTWADVAGIVAKNKVSENEQSRIKEQFDRNGLEEDGRILIELRCRKEFKNDFPLFVVHGSDGLALSFIPLAEKLDCPVYAFQTGDRYIGKDIIVPTMEKFAEIYLNEIKKVQPKGPYNLAGYSGGANIAYAIASQLENLYNEEVNFILLDGCCVFGEPNEPPSTNTLMRCFDLFNEVLSLSPEEREKLKNVWSQMDTYEHQLSIFQWIDEKFQLENSDQMFRIRNQLSTGLNVLTMASQFTPAYKFKGRVSEIKPQNSFLSNLDGNNYYCFSRVCEAPISFSVVSGDHKSFLEFPNVVKTADVINKILIKN